MNKNSFINDKNKIDYTFFEIKNNKEKINIGNEIDKINFEIVNNNNQKEKNKIDKINFEIVNNKKPKNNILEENNFNLTYQKKKKFK